MKVLNKTSILTINIKESMIIMIMSFPIVVTIYILTAATSFYFMNYYDFGNNDDILDNYNDKNPYQF